MRVAINCGGGDAPGLNAAIHAAVHAAAMRGWEIVGIRDSYDGLLRPDAYPDGGLVPLSPAAVAHIVHRGGTILGTTNRGDPFRLAEEQPDGTVCEVDRSDAVVAAFARHGFDALVAIGGDGSLAIAHRLAERGLRVVGVPKTIDNDLGATATTFGFDSAVSFATECIDRLHATAQAHRRIMVVEVMGRHAGWIALHAGVAGAADVILIPEIPYDLPRVATQLVRRRVGGRTYAIVVVAEGAFPAGGAPTIRERVPGAADRLGGIGERVAAAVGAETGWETRAVVLGHLLRGGMPTATDRLLGLAFGAAAIRALADGRDDVMMALRPPRIAYVPLAEAVQRRRVVPLDGEAILTARTLGIALGD
jgi:phosphofructokinase-like protein